MFLTEPLIIFLEITLRFYQLNRVFHYIMEFHFLKCNRGLFTKCTCVVEDTQMSIKITLILIDIIALVTLHLVRCCSRLRAGGGWCLEVANKTQVVWSDKGSEGGGSLPTQPLITPSQPLITDYYHNTDMINKHSETRGHYPPYH